jgi:hypothetical protein
MTYKQHYLEVSNQKYQKSDDDDGSPERTDG